MTNRISRQALIAQAIAAAVALSAVPTAFAASGHEHAAHAPTLRLNAGAKWQTDAPLREGMSKIRADVERTLPSVHSGQLTAGQYAALGKAIETQLAYIVGNCKLAPEADAVLHGVVLSLSEGADILTGKRAADDRTVGVQQVVAALDNYGRYFDHPGWTRVAAS
ncbi:MAG TPA: hypothetical protein VJ673_13900 [Aromatoleum sp.]|uniref:hypothetical protein n=1 Tax=Aromatoleum sp. TaxID=2307007 RepID=UPI002B46B1ED|nr:hypothetical protein [Aromatoleum sp.]HJV26776.1 hypothetical protein [Aromatoleum sp.]